MKISKFQQALLATGFALFLSNIANADYVRRCWRESDGRRRCDVVEVNPGQPTPTPQPTPPPQGRMFRVGDRAYNLERENVMVTIIGIEADGEYIIRYDEGALIGQRGGNWDDADLARTWGCAGRFCVGDIAYNTERDSAKVQVIGIQSTGEYLLYYMDGVHLGKRGGNWDDIELASPYGCGRSFCVGQTVLNTKRDYVRTQIVAIEADGQYVLHYLEGVHAGKRGGNWNDIDLAYAR